jgi:AcrR family transcriptional regulator
MQKGAQTREAILLEAANLASLVGLHGLTIGTLARHAGMSKSGLFQHFGSKEQLQVDTLKAGVDRFVEMVIRPALKAPRGVTRLRTLFDNWLQWETGQGLDGGCLFIAASIELDDQPGPARDFLVEHQRMWLDLIATTARKAVGTGDFKVDLDVEQFAYEFHAILLSFHQARRLMRDPKAVTRARTMFERLLGDAAGARNGATTKVVEDDT